MVKGQPVDFGIYVNADEIARSLRDGQFDFDNYEIQTTRNQFIEAAIESGLINEEFTSLQLETCFRMDGSRLILIQADLDERLAQVLADFLRKSLLLAKKKFSFETVFSHASKLDIMRKAAEQGYKVYLYFVSTESPAINIYRVLVRQRQGGHNVPADKIESRYYRSLQHLFEAAQLTYQTFFFDNSKERSSEDSPFKPFAHFKQVNKKKEWDKIDESTVPEWFRTYYSEKVTQGQ